MMLQALMGSAQGAIVSPLPVTILDDTVVSPSNASASLAVNTDGTLSVTGNASIGGPNWFAPSSTGIGDFYWVRMTVNSGTAPSGAATGSWLALTSSRTWTWSRGSLGTVTANVTVEISSDSGGSVVVSSATFTAEATVEP